MSRIFLLIFLSDVFNTIGQIFYKKTANAMDDFTPRDFQGYLGFMGKVLKSGWVWLSLFSMGIALVIWLMALSLGDLSYVYPIGSLQYILVLVAAHYFLAEPINKMKFFGTALVVVGIVMIALS